MPAFQKAGTKDPFITNQSYGLLDHFSESASRWQKITFKWYQGQNNDHIEAKLMPNIHFMVKFQNLKLDHNLQIYKSSLNIKKQENCLGIKTNSSTTSTMRTS